MAKPIDTVKTITNTSGLPLGACQYCQVKAGKFLCSRAEAHDETALAGCANACTLDDWGVCPLNGSR